ncbi:unnamed protein product [Discula destructiva]
MWQRGLAASSVALSLLPLVANGLYLPSNTANGSLLRSYDYIVVGGGPSGLVIANRLSEDASVTVLLLEVGTLDTEGYNVMVPAEIGRDVGSNYDWKLRTTEQEFLDGHTVSLNQGKVMGGSTVLNGMVWTRSSARDYDVWADLNDDQTSGETAKYSWRWADLLPYFQKSETFSAAVDPAASESLSIQPDASIHGDSGFVQVGYSHFFYEQYANFLNGMKQMGVPILSEPNNGTMDGAFVAPSSINDRNQSRSDGRVAYFDQVIERTNLHVATQQMVTRILLKQGITDYSRTQTAVGVEVASAAGTLRNISCKQEVIMAAGAIFSPTLLQVSGIGPQDVLESLDIPVKIDLPGVGANLMDHGMIHPIYTYTNASVFTSSTVTASDDSRNAALEEYYTNRTGPLTAPMISTVAFPSMRHFADDWVQLLQTASSATANTAALPTDADATVRRGYLAQRAQQLRLLRDPTEGAVEILADSIGELSLAMMRPLSRGTVRPRSASIFDLPAVDPRYCADEFDCLVLARALRFNCALISTPAMAVLQPVVQAPYFCPPNASDAAQSADTTDTDARMLALVKQKLVTEFHPSGTTAMLPQELGGVVDTDLKVYGTSNLRVVDAGVMPVVVGAHLQAVVYAVAERAADIIKEARQSSQPRGPLGPPWVRHV